MMPLLRFLFGLSARVGRREYALVGFGLMASKYAVDAVAVWHFTGAAWLPSDSLSPLYSTRTRTFVRVLAHVKRLAETEVAP